MKQTFGITAIVALTLAATRVPSLLSDPQTHASAAVERVAHLQGQVQHPAHPVFLGGCTVFDEETDARPGAEKDPNRGAARSVINSFFAIERTAQLRQIAGVRYALAFAPDPRHTNLSLWFDREIVAIQQAAQDEGFVYNSSWLPWRNESPTYARLEDERLLEAETDQREACPGVLLFRHGVSAAESDHPGAGSSASFDQALVVLVVGEQPTGGINEAQWSNAVAWLNRNAAVPPASQPITPLPILGPSFSGSLASLDRNLSLLPAANPGAPVLLSRATPLNILSGTVTSCSSIRWFESRLAQRPAPQRALFGSFQENDELQIFRFLSYLNQQGYRSPPDAGNSSVAILSEDETAYAAPAVTASECSYPYADPSQPLRIAYPRDISALRSAYEKQSVFDKHTDNATHPILQESAAMEAGADNASDTVRPYSGGMSAIEQEAVLYGMVSVLRAHHARFLMLRCTNPLDFLFLTRFFHRAYPQGRVVTVSSDLLFRREIDTTEFRGVLALSNYPLLPQNQHWAHVAPPGCDSSSHTHRIFDSQLQGLYLAARYIFDRQAAVAAPEAVADAQAAAAGPCGMAAGAAAPWQSQNGQLILPFKAELPDFAVPFWVGDPDPIQAPTWLSVVGRDGYWPVAVLNHQTTPQQQHLNLAQAKPDSPPSTMVQIEASGRRHDLVSALPPVYRHSILFSIPLPLWIAMFCAALLLLYQLFGITLGYRYTSIGFFTMFRRNFSRAHAVLLGLNSGFATAIVVQLLWVAFTPADSFVEGIGAFKWLTFFFCVILTLEIAVAVFLLEQSDHDSAGQDRSAAHRRRRQVEIGLLVSVSLIAVLASLTVIPYAVLYGFHQPSNGIPLFYRLSHIFSGVSPLVPVLFVVVGFYVWTWQALAGSALLCPGRPLLPLLRDVKSPPGLLRSRYLRFIGVDCSSRQNELFYLNAVDYRISSEMEKHILKVANPLSLQLRVYLLPFIFWVICTWCMRGGGPPLLGLESYRFALWINRILLFAFLLTTAEAGRLFFTWIELRRLLTALNRRPLRRTFSKLRAISAGSLWSVSGSVQRVQSLFFSQQIEAASRLARLLSSQTRQAAAAAKPAGPTWPACPLVATAVSAGRAFLNSNAHRIDTGPLWDQRITVDAAVHPELKHMPPFLIRIVLNNAAGETIRKILCKAWAAESLSLNMQTRPAKTEEHERNAAEMELSHDAIVAAAEEFICLHYISFIQNILARMRTMILSMASLFVAICLAISFYPFVPRTQIFLWMLINLALIAAVVVYVYAGMERDETLSYITNTPPGRLGSEFYVKTAAFLAGPVLGLLTTQFPAISESLLSWVQPGFDALK